jgi:SAM-dependent methyltransferase
VEFRIGSGESLPAETGTADVVVAGLVLNFIPDPGGAVAESRRVLRPGGILAAYVWDYAGEMQLMRRLWDAAVELDPAATAVVEGLRFTMDQPQVLADLFTSAGLERVATVGLTIPTVFRDFEDYWQPFLGGTGPAPAYVAGLPEAAREALRRRLEETLPTSADGAIPLIARAWAVKGHEPRA